MAKRSIVERDDIELEGSEIMPMDKFGYPIVPNDIVLPVQLVLCRNIKLNITGPVTGNVYHFDGAGSMVEVDASDAPGMLLKRSQSSCCGGNPSPYFVVGGQ